MKKVLLKYGGYSAITILLLFTISYLFMDPEIVNYTVQEVFGYLSMLVALLFVFFGIKNYRDEHNQGTISFGRALGVGMLIALIPAIIFGVFDAIYVAYINPDFFQEYTSQMAEQYSGAELEAKMAEMEGMEFFMSPLGTFILMGLTVLILGFIVSLISSMFLRKKAVTA